MALHGMEGAAGVRYQSSASNAGHLMADSPVLVRYADDLVVLCHSLEAAETVKPELAAWLAPRGLAFNEDKTKIVHLDEGFDFLGFHVQRHRGKLLITPSKAALVRIRDRIATELKALAWGSGSGGDPAAEPDHSGLVVLLPGSGGVGGLRLAGHSPVASHLQVGQTEPPNKSKRWVVARYFGSFHPGRPNRWVFGDRKSGAYLVRFSWTRIVRHQLVPGRASPDDPDSGRVLGPAPSPSASAAGRSLPRDPSVPTRAVHGLRHAALR